MTVPVHAVRGQQRVLVHSRHVRAGAQAHGPEVFRRPSDRVDAFADPDEYAIAVKELIADFVRYDQDKLLEIARRWATDEQRRALAER